MELLIVPFFSPLSTEELRKSVCNSLGENGNRVIKQTEIKNFMVENISGNEFLIFVGTGGTERIISKFIEDYGLQSPVRLLTYKLANSLPAALELKQYLEHKNMEVILYHGSLEEIKTSITKIRRNLEVKEQLSKKSLGIIGTPSEWLIASYIDRKKVKSRWGIEIIDIPVKDLCDVKIPSEIDENIVNRIKNAGTSVTIPDEEIFKAEIVNDQLEMIINEKSLDAITVECFSLLENTNITSCFGLAKLNAKGIVAGCEGDIPTAISMMIVRELLRKPSFMVNITSFNSESNTVNFAHCTVPLSMIEDYSITTHFESDMSMAIAGKFKVPQEVTIFKVFGEDLSEKLVAKGIITSNTNLKTACRTQIDVKLDKGYSVDEFINNTKANHHLIILGDHTKEIKDFLSYY